MSGTVRIPVAEDGLFFSHFLWARTRLSPKGRWKSGSTSIKAHQIYLLFYLFINVKIKKMFVHFARFCFWRMVMRGLESLLDDLEPSIHVISFYCFLFRLSLFQNLPIAGKVVFNKHFNWGLLRYFGAYIVLCLNFFYSFPLCR